MRRVRAAAQRVLRRVPVAAWRRLFPKTAVGICYHMVSDVSLPHLRHYPVLGTAAFEADLLYLKRRFGFLTYAQLAGRRDGTRPVRDNAVMLTFDDGFAECASVAAPMLRRHGADCVFFVITDLLDNAVLFRESEASLCIDAVLRHSVAEVEAIMRDLGLQARLPPPPDRAPSGAMYPPLELAGLHRTASPTLLPLLHWLLTIDVSETATLRRLGARLGIDPQHYLQQAQPYLTTQQIRRLREDGFTIGAHGRSHRWLGSLSRADAEQEIVESCRIVRDLTGQASVPFAFPYFGGTLDRAWLAQLRRQHDVIGLFFDTDGLREDEPFVVQRVFGERFGPDRTLDAALRRAWARRPAWGGRGRAETAARAPA